MPYYEFSQGNSNKFWKIQNYRLKGYVYVNYGKIGAKGVEKTFEYTDPKWATSFIRKKTAEKLEKGYIKKPVPKTKKNRIVNERTSKVTKKCPPGKEVNPKTGRCIKSKKVTLKKPSITKVEKSIKPSCPIVKTNIENKNMKYIARGEGGIVFRINNVGNSYALKFSIADYSYPFNINHPVNIEDSILKEVEKLRLKNISPNFNPYSGSTKCGLKQIISKLLRAGYINNRYSEYIISEYSRNPQNMFYRIFLSRFIDGNLKSHLFDNRKQKRSAKYYTILLFIICYNLSVLQYYIKGFRHNDLHLANVFIKINSKKLIDEKKVNKYTIFGETYYIPQLDITPIISDFDFSASDKYKNSKVSDVGYSEYGLNFEKRPYFDLHLFVNLASEEFPESAKVYKKIFPSNVYGSDGSNTKMSRLTHKRRDIITPAELILFKDLFSGFKKLPKGAKIVGEYDSLTPSYEKINKRDDMFSIHLK
jgi:predicted DNA-binding WGR domain protein